MSDLPMRDLQRMLEDYRLTTAEILYHMPDHPDLLQTFVWQQLDRVPDFPKLNGFLDYWRQEIEGRLHSVKIAYVGGIEPTDWKAPARIVTMH